MRKVLDLLVPGLTAFLGSTAGVLVGWRIQRGREKREMRLPVYTEWLKIARSLVGPPGPAPGEPTIILPNPSMKARLNELTTELELVGSRRVVEAVNAYSSISIIPPCQRDWLDRRHRWTRWSIGSRRL